MQDIGTLGGPDAFQVGSTNVGRLPDSATRIRRRIRRGLPTYHPFLWEKGTGMKDLGSFGGAATASVNGLNERGEVVGGLDLPGDQDLHPFVWDGQKLIDLTAPPFDVSGHGEAVWINEAGEVVGSADIPVTCLGSQSTKAGESCLFVEERRDDGSGDRRWNIQQRSQFYQFKDTDCGLLFRMRLLRFDHISVGERVDS